MKTLEKRLFHLFTPADVAKARGIVPAAVDALRAIGADASRDGRTFNSSTSQCSAPSNGGHVCKLPTACSALLAMGKG
jgi:hypothetical protein